MYIGRFVVVGPEGGAYRVSSRSFPNRTIVERDGALTVVPTADAAETDNPYVSYNCLRHSQTASGEIATFGNGSHVDPIAEKLELGYPARDALATGLLALDYEKDDYDTPRIAATLSETGDARIGIVRKDAVLVQQVTEPTIVATYELDAPEPYEFPVSDAATAARDAIDLEFEHAVCAAGIARTDDGLAVATADA